ncbi:MAG: ureJ [Rhodospirillales bacterium]|jgi:urease accessory protein|nr:ureJ [Rhodospirillales bacterium]
MKRAALTLLLLLVATPALAHPGHEAGLLGGLVHPMLGADHLIAALLVGLWASQLGGRARFAVPLLFVGTVALGAVPALAGFAPPAIETGILLSMLVPGLLLASAMRMPIEAVAVLVACFAWLHGAAHGLERTGDAGAYLAGLLLTTAALHATGLGLATLLRARGVRLAGAASALASMLFAFA